MHFNMPNESVLDVEILKEPCCKKFGLPVWQIFSYRSSN